MASRLPTILRLPALRIMSARAVTSGNPGDGVGKGGGAGGAVREAGGAFGKMEVAKEEQYFRQLQKEQMEKLKDLLEDEVSHHERQIRQHQDAIEHHKKKISRLNKKTDGSDSD
ncbi:ATPase inhibitor mai-2 mitochondrial [Biomphalaria pfeifferi]|uniref:ATP synthase F1 subunit epsilon n=1 Tax=Biomphalaria pfeifferi TaxID=112525 RepID=A0AAD8BFV5_BIOPF|nr:ATPase inhibitor mai-2 mitochondrial [Biomphalaria pfeifferi]